MESSKSIRVFKYVKHRCFVLIDEYDSMYSLLISKDSSFLHLGTIYFLLKDNVENVCVTGLPFIHPTDSLFNIKLCKFLQNDKFLNFYGLIFDEIEDLGKRFSFKEGEF